MGGFNKIDLETVPSQPSNAIVNNSEPEVKAKLKIAFPKKPLIIFGVVVVVLFVLGLILTSPVRRVYSDAKATAAQAQSALNAVKKQNIALAAEELDKTREKLNQTQTDLQVLSFLKFIPVASWYYNDATHLLKAGFFGLGGAKILVDSVKPYADLLGLKGQGSFVGGTASQRIETAVRTMGTITPHIDEIAKSLELAKQEIDQVSEAHYPSLLGGDKIRKQLTSVKALADNGVLFVNEARPLIKILPSLLGEPKEKKYLVLFQNDKELRPTGGFITAYAVFRIDRGIIHVDRSDDIYTLDSGVYGKPKAPAPILKYLPNVPLLNLRDTNLSPDFIESMKTFNSLYQKAAGKVDVDGVIALDTHVLVSTIKILDDSVDAGGIRFTTKTDPRCNCPQIIYQLESLISTPLSLDLRITPLAAVQAQRKDILGTLLYAIMEKALKSSPKLYWGPLFQDMLSETNQKHILFYIYDKDAQSGIEALNAAGRIKAFEGDYLHINEANFGGAKSNMYVSESVSQKYETKQDGTIVKTVTIDYKNPFAPSDCNLERGNLCLNAVLRNFLRIYVPKGSQLINSAGSEVKLSTYEELEKTVFEGFLTVRPKGVAAFTISYSLPFKVAASSPLPVLIQKQPGTNDNEYTIIVNGKTTNKFPLLSDQQLKLQL